VVFINIYSLSVTGNLMVRFHQNAGGYSVAFTICHFKGLKYNGILMKMPKIG
jgi:hypothetical protein